MFDMMNISDCAVWYMQCCDKNCVCNREQQEPQGMQNFREYGCKIYIYAPKYLSILAKKNVKESMLMGLY
jgi:hypothetical protein